MRTGLEPATPGVTGRYSNQLNYRTNCSVLCVFLERGCKGRYFFETCKLFSTFLRKKCRKVQKKVDRPGFAYRLALFNLNHAFFIFDLLLCRFRNSYIKYSVVDVGIDHFFVCIVGEKQSLIEF